MLYSQTDCVNVYDRTSYTFLDQDQDDGMNLKSKAACFVLSAVVLIVAGACVAEDQNTMSLAGTWRFSLDAEGKGIEEKWFTRPLDGTVTLPGTTDENEKGVKKDVRCIVSNMTEQTIEALIEIRTETWNTDESRKFGPKSTRVKVAVGETTTELNYPFEEECPLWDEFNPAMIRLAVTITGRTQEEEFKDSRTVDFGMRDFRARRNQFTINGKAAFLRGKNDACIFPLTGYSPMDKAAWLAVMGTAKSYGINHYRFHPWCPPEAAFQAADELGIYLQPELPNKRTAFNRPEHGGYLRREGELIFKAYGNHPSFVMLALGNELGRQQARSTPVPAQPARLHELRKIRPNRRTGYRTPDQTHGL